MNQLFNLDGPVMQFISRVTDLIVLNIIFLIFCIPVITAGASLSALYYVLLKLFRGEEPYILRSFFKAFRQNFRQSTIIWIFLFVVVVFLGLDFFIVNSRNTVLFMIIRIILWMVSGFLFGIFLYIFPLISHFECSTKQVFRNAVLMMFTHLPYTLIMFGICGAVLYLCMDSFRNFVIVTSIAGICGCSVLAFIFCSLFDKIFRKYEPKDENSEE